MSSRLFISALLLSAVSCRHAAPREPLPALRGGLAPEAARARAEATEDPALAAELAWLLANDRAYATARLDAALEARPDEPALRLRRALLALEASRLDAMVDDLLEVLVSAKDSSEAEVALVLLYEHLPRLTHRDADVSRAVRASGLLDGPTSTAGRVPLAAALLAEAAFAEGDDAEAEAALARAGYLLRLRRIGPLAPYDPGALSPPPRYELTGDWSMQAHFRGRPVEISDATAVATTSLSGASSPGLYVFDTYFEVSTDAADAALSLEAALPAHARVRIDDTVVLVRDGTRRVEGRRTQVPLRLAPGWHRLAITALTRPTTRLSVALTSRDGQRLTGASRSGPLIGSPVTTPPAIGADALAPQGDRSSWGLVRRLAQSEAHAPFARYLGSRLAQSRWFQDPDRAWWLLHGTRAAFGESSAFAFAEARLRALRGQGPRAQALLQEGLHGDPRHPGALTALARALVDERPERALELLETAVEAAPDAWAPWEARFVAARALGWTAQAADAIEQALARNPPERIFERAIRFYEGIERYARADEVSAALDARSPRGAPARAGQRAERRGDIDAAIRAYRRAAAVEAPLPHLVRIAELELARGHDGDAVRVAEEILRRAPGHPRALKVQLRAALLEGDLGRAEAALGALRARSESTLELEALLGDLEPHAALRGALAHDRWKGVLPTGPGAPPPGRDPADRWAEHDEVVLLDRVVDQLLPDGRVLSWHHDITRLQTKEATDRAGEVAIPPDALLLTLRTLKQDGREIEVDRHAGKDDLSFSALAPGDAIERRWVRIEGNATAYGGYLRRFYFRASAPLVRSELVLVAPEDLPVAWSSRHGAPEPTVTSSAGVKIRRWRRDDVPASPPEPLSTSPDEYLPHIDVWADLDPRRARLANLAAARTAARGSREIDALARTLTATVADPEARLERLFLWVEENIDEGPLAPAEQVLARRRGAREGLLVALARAAGVPAELAWARDGMQPPIDGEVPDPRAFGALVVRAEPRPGRIVWASQAGLLGALPPPFAEGEVLRSGPRGPLVEPLTASDVATLTGRSKVVLEVDATGGARGRVTLEIPAPFAASTRDFLRSARAEVLDRQLQGLVARLVRGARLVAHRAGPVEARLEDLVLELDVEIPHFMTRDGPYLVVEELFERPLVLPAMGQPLLDAYLRVSHRETPVLVRPAAERMEVVLRLPEGVQAPEVAPQDLDAELEVGHVSQSFGFDAKTRTARLVASHETRLARVSAEAYPDFSAGVQRVLQGLRNRLVVRVGERARGR